MDLQLKGKRALVTGSSSGIGEGIAKALAKEGVTVVVHGRNEKEASRVVREIAVDGGKAFVAIGDLATDGGAEQVVHKVLSVLGAVDILVNNAGTYSMRGWMNSTPNQWLELYNINVVSMVRTTLLLLPQMQELGWGRIINIASSVATKPTSVADYSATKAANLNLTVSLAQELTGTGIAVNAVSPGSIVTPRLNDIMLQIGLNQGWGTDLVQIQQHMLRGLMNNPTNSLGKVEDVAHIVTFLASPLADYINGANLRVDGGWVPTMN
ncbi:MULTISPECIES: SDR family NAD(P)-dependent oxidoreductase [Nostocales]|uniref:SDR family NAD(P)-dependent oxidoreductase n=3 Tax=Nostocales TaxID=1161 RepID=A0A0C1QZ46_9CYAN|nr:SDR family NAD(P)-dependent oxidoreductase [Tolypothrix bouteillei]KAF3885436.1 SDR family NAD(P)-dependent oxidoreductase [Tolypothrix bouteillei VB521301]